MAFTGHAQCVEHSCRRVAVLFSWLLACSLFTVRVLGFVFWLPVLFSFLVFSRLLNARRFLGSIRLAPAAFEKPYRKCVIGLYLLRIMSRFDLPLDRTSFASIV